MERFQLLGIVLKRHSIVFDMGFQDVRKAISKSSTPTWLRILFLKYVIPGVICVSSDEPMYIF